MAPIKWIQPHDNIWSSTACRNYLMALTPDEIVARDIQPSQYPTMVREWSATDIDKMTVICRLADLYCYDFVAIRSIPWKLVKMDNRIEWGMPFTLGDIIFLPANYVDRDPLQAAETLVHEKIHVDQRARQDEYDQFYRMYMKWQYVPNMRFPDAIYRRIIHNPDGMDGKWIWNNSLIMTLEYNGTVAENYYSKDWTPGNRRELIQLYGTDKHMYHPNEMFAHIAASWIFMTGLRPIDPNIVRFMMQ